MKYYLDTNFILRYLLGDDKEMLEVTSEYFNKAQVGEITLILEQTVFTEVIFVLSSFYKVPRNKIAETFSNLLSYKAIEVDFKEALLNSLNLFSTTSLHIVDCILIAKSKSLGIEILSFDKELNNNLSKEL